MSCVFIESIWKFNITQTLLLLFEQAVHSSSPRPEIVIATLISEGRTVFPVPFLYFRRLSAHFRDLLLVGEPGLLTVLYAALFLDVSRIYWIGSSTLGQGWTIKPHFAHRCDLVLNSKLLDLREHSDYEKECVSVIKPSLQRYTLFSLHVEVHQTDLSRAKRFTPHYHIS